MVSPSGEASTPPLVLLVDDVEDTRLIYAAYLQHRGLRTAIASNAKQAFERVEADHPDVIVMDFSMPGMDGIAAARQLATDPATAHIPLILITGHREVVRPSIVKAAGARSLIIKPCLPEVLEAEIQRLLAGDQEFRSVSGVPPD